MRWLSNVVLFLVALLFAAPIGADEPAAKAVEKAFDKAKAAKAVDDAFARVKAPAVKSAAKAVEEAFKAAKAKGKPDAKDPATPERLPMPREVQVGTAKGAWYIDCPAGPCSECETACKCLACVCESVTTSHPPVQAEPAKPKRKEWATGYDSAGKAYSVLMDFAPDESPAVPAVTGSTPIVKTPAMQEAVGSPVTFAASPCANGQCPAPTTGVRRR